LNTSLTGCSLRPSLTGYSPRGLQGPSALCALLGVAGYTPPPDLAPPAFSKTVHCRLSQLSTNHSMLVMSLALSLTSNESLSPHSWWLELSSESFAASLTGYSLHSFLFSGWLQPSHFSDWLLSSRFSGWLQPSQFSDWLQSFRLATPSHFSDWLQSLRFSGWLQPSRFSGWLQPSRFSGWLQPSHLSDWLQSLRFSGGYRFNASDLAVGLTLSDLATGLTL